MKIGIVGAGASGIYSAILLKRKYPSVEIFLFEKEKKIGRKIYSTGNGHCNILNADVNGTLFNKKQFIDDLLKKYPFGYLLKTLNSFGVATFQKENLIYPLTYSAPSLMNVLESQLINLGVKILVNEKVLDYHKSLQNIDIITDNDKYNVNYLLLCGGGKSSPNLGSDGSLYSILERHNYYINPLRPGLCPIVVKEKKYLKELAGFRHTCSATLFKNNEFITKEEGEFIYKADGLSGICIFNLESLIMRENSNAKYVIKIDLFPNLDLSNVLTNVYNILGDNFLEAIVPNKIHKEIYRQLAENKLDHNLKSIEYILHNLSYTYESHYSFNESQVTIGGVDLNEMNNSLMSKKENNVFFLGEIVDINGLCGGNNLTWALLSALIVTDSI